MSSVIDHQTPTKTDAEVLDLALWAKEKQAIETYALFYAEQLDPFMRDLLINLSSEPSNLSRLSQQLDIFSLRYDQLMTKDERKNSVTAELFHRLSSDLITFIQKLAKIAQSEIDENSIEARTVILEKDEEITSMKD